MQDNKKYALRNQVHDQLTNDISLTKIGLDAYVKSLIAQDAFRPILSPGDGDCYLMHTMGYVT